MYTRRASGDPKLLDLVTDLIEAVGEEPKREGLRETPRRVIEALMFQTSGYNQDPQEVLKCFEDGGERCDEMVLQRDVPFWSLCEHHLLPFFGVAHIAYIPNGKIAGLSKLARVLEIFARRFQVQERLTSQVADALMNGLHPKGVGVIIEARHSCMESRGIQKAGTSTITSALRGVFKDKAEVRQEFLSIAHK